MDVITVPLHGPINDFPATVSNGSPYVTGPLSCQSVCIVGIFWPSGWIGWIKMPPGAEVGLVPGHIVLYGDPAPPRKGAQQTDRLQDNGPVTYGEPLQLTVRHMLRDRCPAVSLLSVCIIGVLWPNG